MFSKLKITYFILSVMLFFQLTAQENINDSKAQAEGQTAIMLKQLFDPPVVFNLGDYRGNKTEEAHLSAIKNSLMTNKDVNVPIKKQGLSPLMLAVLAERYQVVELLLSMGAEVNYENPTGLTALMLCVGRRNVFIANMLIDKGAKIETDKYSALTVALSNFDVVMIQFLISRGASVDYKDSKGETPKDYLDAKYKMVSNMLVRKEQRIINNNLVLFKDIRVNKATFENAVMKDVMLFLKATYFRDYTIIYSSDMSKNLIVNTSISESLLPDALRIILDSVELDYHVDEINKRITIFQKKKK